MRAAYWKQTCFFFSLMLLNFYFAREKKSNPDLHLSININPGVVTLTSELMEKVYKS